MKKRVIICTILLTTSANIFSMKKNGFKKGPKEIVFTLSTTNGFDECGDHLKKSSVLNMSFQDPDEPSLYHQLIRWEKPSVLGNIFLTSRKSDNSGSFHTKKKPCKKYQKLLKDAMETALNHDTKTIVYIYLNEKDGSFKPVSQGTQTDNKTR